MNRDIHRLAALITEDVDEYLDLGDISDEDAFKAAEPSSYSCGIGCWEYEELPMTVNGQTFLGRAEIEYENNSDYVKGYPATRFDPGEQAHIEPIVGDFQVKEFEIYDNQGNTIVHWARREPLAGDLSAEQIQDIIDQISKQFEEDEERVHESILQHAEEDWRGDPDDYYDY